ncbi:hypothetical protein EM6_3036 [Asticcacaulis excentricus]|uniref:Uncharacterized protein n=2 Tax=Asticcacaulis excentricus TaxID=78587 RepID=A0A3G9GCI3_9CAUL|nr:hypothetical protein EM6_3036 [Asticcacaulis excentricus]
MITLLPKDVTVQLGDIKEDTDWIEIPYTYTRPVTLKSPIKGEMLGIEVMPAGTTGFAAAWAGDRVRFSCYFIRPNFNKIDYSSPQCFGAHPFRQDRVSRMKSMSNIPLTFTYSTADGSIFRLPEHEPLTTPFDHSFKLSLRIGGWNKKAVRMQWFSDGYMIFGSDLPLDAEGRAVLPVKGGQIRLSRHSDNAKLTSVEFIPAS